MNGLLTREERDCLIEEINGKLYILNKFNEKFRHSLVAVEKAKEASLLISILNKTRGE